MKRLQTKRQTSAIYVVFVVIIVILHLFAGRLSMQSLLVCAFAMRTTNFAFSGHFFHYFVTFCYDHICIEYICIVCHLIQYRHVYGILCNHRENSRLLPFDTGPQFVATIP